MSCYEYQVDKKLVFNYHSDVTFELLLPRSYIYKNVQNRFTQIVALLVIFNGKGDFYI